VVDHFHFVLHHLEAVELAFLVLDVQLALYDLAVAKAALLAAELD